MSIFNVFKTNECPICGEPTKATNKVLAKYNKKNLCQNCSNKLYKAGVNLLALKKYSLEELQRIAGVRVVVQPMTTSSVMTQKTITEESKQNIEVNATPVIKSEPIKKKRAKSSQTFSFFSACDNSVVLKYKYYDVVVQGVKYSNVDFSKINVDKYIIFKKEPDNEYDANAIQVKSDGIVLGYVPKNNIQSMIHDYLDVQGRDVSGFISQIDEEAEMIKVAIGFYKEISEEDLAQIPHIDTSLTKTSKKDEFGISRQDNLEGASEGEEVDLDYQYDTDTYLVTLYGDELGEISSAKSEKLSKLEEEGYELTGLIQELGYNDSGKVTCKIRVYCISE